MKSPFNRSWITASKVSRFARNRHFFVLDIVLLSLAAYLSFVLRLESWALGEYRQAFVYFVPFVLFITLAVLYWAGAYNRYWQYASVKELLLLAGSIALSTILISLITLLSHAGIVFPTIPRSIPFIFFLLAGAVVTTPRLLVRLSSQYQAQRHYAPASPAKHPAADEKRLRVVVMGAGNVGAMIVRELQQVGQSEMEVVGFLDDDPTKHKLHIHGVPVLGGRQDIPDVVERFDVQQVIIAMPAASGRAVREMKTICEQAGVRTRVIPGLYELIDGKVSVNHVRDVQIEDLLRREPINTDVTAIRELLQGKCVLVTGGGGSIGSELCRQVLRCNPSELVIVGHGENSVFEIYSELQKFVKQQEQANGEPACTMHAVIGDIRFANRIRSIFEQYRPQVVFHAAAHKHVPLMEYSPAEAITNNVLGTHYLLEAALAVDVERFVMISSDKAVNPTSVMGASKRIAELLVHQAVQKSGRAYVAVRFGNVLGSRGSVVLTFKKQIAAGGPVTVTDPRMCRYFMTIPEAVQLVLQATVLGEGGEVMTLDMGEQVKIVDLARDMIELSGLEVGRDIDITFVGLRPGEKLYEELFTADEQFERTAHEKIFIATNASKFVPLHLEHWVELLALAADCNDINTIMLVLQHLLPENQLRRLEQMKHEQIPTTRLVNVMSEAQAAKNANTDTPIDALSRLVQVQMKEDKLQPRTAGAS